MIYPEYFKPQTIEEIWKKDFSGKKIYYLSGGTDLVNALRDGLLDADKSWFVDISSLGELKNITEDAKYVKIGSAATFDEISVNKLVLQWCPALAFAAKTIGTPQIYNRATIGGNVANASPSGDSIPALMVHLAKIEVINKESKKILDINEIFLGPKKTSLANGDLITAILIPKVPAISGIELKGTFKKIGGRKSHIISKVSVAVSAQVAGQKIESIRVAFGAVGPKVLNVPGISEILEKSEIDKDKLEKCALEIQKVITPIDDFRSTAEYRRTVAPALFIQAMDDIMKES